MDAADVEQMRKRDKYSDVAPSLTAACMTIAQEAFASYKPKYLREPLRVTFGLFSKSKEP